MWAAWRFFGCSIMSEYSASGGFSPCKAPGVTSFHNVPIAVVGSFSGTCRTIQKLRKRVDRSLEGFLLLSFTSQIEIHTQEEKKYGGLSAWRPAFHLSLLMIVSLQTLEMWKVHKVKMNLKSCTIQRFLQQFFFNVVTRGNNNSTRHIKQLASLCLQCLHLDQKELVRVYHLSIVTTIAEGQCFTISSVSGLRLFFPHFLLFQCAIFCVFVYLWVLLQACLWLIQKERQPAKMYHLLSFIHLDRQ